MHRVCRALQRRVLLPVGFGSVAVRKVPLLGRGDVLKEGSDRAGLEEFGFLPSVLELLSAAQSRPLQSCSAHRAQSITVLQGRSGGKGSYGPSATGKASAVAPAEG